MSRFSTFASIALALGIAALMPACSKNDEYFLLVNVSLQSGVATPDSVQLTATQNGATLRQTTVSWSPAPTGIDQVGLGLPSDTTGTVVVNGVALLQGQQVGQGSVTATKIVAGQNNGPFVLLIAPVPVSGNDGGTGGATTGGTTGGSTGTRGTGGTSGAGGAGGSGDAGDSATGGAIGTGGAATGGATGTGGGASTDAGSDLQHADSSTDGTSADASVDAAGDSPVALDGSHNDGPVADVAVDATASRQWSPTRNVQNNPASSVYPTPSVAVSPTTGDAVVAWVDSSNGVQVIRYAAATDTWDTAPTTLDSRGDPRNVQVGVDGNGHYIAVWAQFDQTVTPLILGIWASYSSDGVKWSNSPALLAAGPSNAYYGDLRLAVNRAGQAWVVWDQSISPILLSNPSTPQSVNAVFISGTTAKPAIVVQSGKTYYINSNGEQYPRVAIDGKGNGLVVWNDSDGNPAVGNLSTWAAALVDGTTPVPKLIESYDADYTFGSDVAMNADGQGVAIWAENTSGGGSADVFARRYGVTSGWEVPEPQRLTHANYSGNLSVDEDRYGTVDIGWSQPSTGGYYQAMFSTQAVGGTWTSAFEESGDLAPGYTTTDIEPQVRTALTSGDMLMSWRKRLDGSTFAPHFRWRSNGAWGADSEVGKIANLYASEIHTAVADDGRAVAAWTYYHCYYDDLHPDECSDVPLTSLPASAQAAIANVFVAVYK
jgi:hypothetical protein